MNNVNFVYWLKGFFELTNAEELTKEQVVMIKEHLDLCLNKVTPELGEGIKRTDTTYVPSYAPTIVQPPNPDWNKIYCDNELTYSDKDGKSKLIC